MIAVYAHALTRIREQPPYSPRPESQRVFAQRSVPFTSSESSLAMGSDMMPTVSRTQYSYFFKIQCKCYIYFHLHQSAKLNVIYLNCKVAYYAAETGEMNNQHTTG